MSPWLESLLWNLLGQTPPLLVQLVGLILAMLWWRRHPAVSLSVLGAVTLIIFSTIVPIVLFPWLSSLTVEQHWTNSQRAMVFGVVNGVRGLIVAVAWGLVLFAVFGARSPVRPPRTEDEEADFR